MIILISPLASNNSRMYLRGPGKKSSHKYGDRVTHLSSPAMAGIKMFLDCDTNRHEIIRMTNLENVC